MFIIHKTQILTAILRCLTGLTCDWFKSYDANHKHFHFFSFVILYKNRLCIFVFFVITFVVIKNQTHSASQNDRLDLSFVKDIYVDGGKVARNGHKTAI